MKKIIQLHMRGGLTMCGVEMDDDNRTALSGDGGPIDDDYQWEETFQVSDENDN